MWGDNGCAIMDVMSPGIGAIQVLCNAFSLEIDTPPLVTQ